MTQIFTVSYFKNNEKTSCNVEITLIQIKYFNIF